MTLNIRLPWPPRTLHPNFRTHWAIKARAAKRARGDAYLIALSSGARKLSSADVERLSVAVTFLPPDARRRDVDGALSACKPALDGIADAIGVDDSRWSFRALTMGESTPGGAVEIVLEAAP